jgi:heterodisulfide reductase subunit A
MAPAKVVGLKGEPGNFAVKVRQAARYIDMAKCISCGLCAEKCPKKVPDEFNLGLAKRKAAYMTYAQAIPAKYAIDKEVCLFFKKGGKCKACEKFCPTGAVDFSQVDVEKEINVGAVILAPGFKSYDPTQYAAYHYANFPNVVTGLEFERILAAAGPFQGHLVRPSDHKEPTRIAWLQCVGSRDLNHCDNSHCSAVCCMYAIKEAIIAKEHSKEPLDAAIFFMDMRTHGKEFEKYYWRARDDFGIRFIRSRVHTIDAVPGTDDVALRYLDEEGNLKDETFDMLVLSTGMEVPPQVLELGKTLGVKINANKFADTSAFTPVSTSQDGIYVCGAFQGPKDIPQSVMEASAAASAASELLSSARFTLAKKKPVFAERDVAQEVPRIGVFVCHCGINIASVVDVEGVRDYAKTLPYVEYVENNLFACSQDTQELIKERIKEHNLNRVVVASCTPRTHEPTFQETITEAGLNKYLFQMANIRDQGSWVHMQEPERATQRAKDQVRMAVATASLQPPLQEFDLPVTKAGLVVGGGVAGMEAALGLAGQGYQVHLVEKKAFLGGHALKLNHTWNGEAVQPYVSDLVQRVTANPRIEVYLNSAIADVQGFVGNFTTTISTEGQGEKSPGHRGQERRFHPVRRLPGTGAPLLQPGLLHPFRGKRPQAQRAQSRDGRLYPLPGPAHLRPAGKPL